MALLVKKMTCKTFRVNIPDLVLRIIAFATYIDLNPDECASQCKDFFNFFCVVPIRVFLKEHRDERVVLDRHVFACMHVFKLYVQCCARSTQSYAYMYTNFHFSPTRGFV